MKKFNQISLILAFVLILGCLLPNMAQATSEGVSMSVGSKYMRAKYSADAEGIYEIPNLGVWTLQYDLNGGGAHAKLGGVWDRDYLYLAYDKQEGDPVPEVTMNGVAAQSIAVKSSDTHSIIRIPFEECGVFMDSLGYYCDLSVNVGSLSWSGTVMFITQEIPAINGRFQSQNITNNNLGYNFTLANGDAAQAVNGSYDNYLNVWDVIPFHTTNNQTIVLEFDLQVNSLPQVDMDAKPEKHWAIGNGLHFIITDEANSTTSTLRNGFTFLVCNVGGKLAIRSNNEVWKKAETFVTDIPVSRDDTVHFRIEYDNFDVFVEYDEDTEVQTRNKATARFYVNGVMIGTDVDCKSKRTSTTADCAFGVALLGDGVGTYDVSVGNICVDYLTPETNLGGASLDGLTFHSFMGNNLSVNGINSDLQLPAYVPGGQLNGLKLAWSSNNEEAISADGKVNTAATETSVELTASIVGMDTTKTFYLNISDDHMVVPGAKKEIELDGELKDNGWVFATEIIGDANPISMGGLWTDSNLYIGCEKIDTANMTLVVNGKTIENVISVSGEKYTEIQIPLADVGLTAAEGTVCPISILLDGVEFNGQFTFGAKDTSITIQEIFLYALIAVCVIFAGLVVLAIVKKLYKKIWFIIILAVVLLGGVFCGIAMNQSYDVDDGRGSLPTFQMPSGDLASKIPALAENYGSVLVNTENNVVIEVLKVSPEQFAAYVELCRETEFYNTTTDMDACYAATNADEFVLSVNYVENKEKMLLSVSVPTLLPKLIFDNIRNDNVYSALVTSNIRLPESAANGAEGVDTYISWTTSDPRVVALDGTVNRPDFGEKIVTLTATVSGTGEQKIFTVRVPGYDFNDGTLVVENDVAPGSTSGKKTSDVTFTLDMTNNSIITDLGQTQKVNYVKITDLDDISRLNTTTFSLWGSDDNMSYTRINEFKLMQVGKVWYLYDFETEARYIKLHYGMYDVLDSSVIGGCGEMIRAGYEEVFGGNGAEFKTSEYTLTNLTGKKQYDYPWTVSKKDLGISGSDNSVRIYLDGELLYHYVDGDNVVVRVPEVDQGASVTLKVMSSDSAAPMDVSNKEFVYEVVYGQTEVWNSEQSSKTGRYVLGILAGTKFPDGSVQEESELLTMSAGTVYRSKDGGSTWVPSDSATNIAVGGTPVPGDVTPSTQGWGIDTVTGRIFCTWHSYAPGYTFQNSPYRVTHIVYSDDGGHSWSYTVIPRSTDPNSPNYSFNSYNDIETLSFHDGDGPNVDLIFPAGGKVPNENILVSQIAYSKDGGTTWHLSETQLTVDVEAGFEMGASEPTVIERDDGVLVLLSRYQAKGATKFAITYSTDQGVTWSPMMMEESSVYASNTQPVLHKFNINGELVNLLNIPGHNAMGGTSYIRVPLVFASTTNGETFRNIKNVLAKSEGALDYSTHTITNTSFYKFNENDVYMAWDNALTAVYGYMRITDFDKWYTRTEGAYDSFEHGTVEYEDWDIYTGSVTATKELSTDGNWSLHAERITQFTRFVPYMQDGTMSFNLYVTDKPLRLNIELQSALLFDDGRGVAPIGIDIDDNVITFLGSDEATGLTLQQGWNTLVFDMDLANGKATFRLNGGETMDMPVDLEAGDYFCYVTFNGRREFYLDEFMVVNDMDITLNATEEDRVAANAVIEMIKTMGTDATAVDAARKAYDALTVVQRDFVDRRCFNADGTYVNYYDLLVAAEGK